VSAAPQNRLAQGLAGDHAAATEVPQSVSRALLLKVTALSCLRGNGPLAYRIDLPRLSLHAGEVVAVTGASGSGKSTLLEVLGLVAAPHRDSAMIWHGPGDPIDLSALWRRNAQHRLAQLRAACIGFVMQTGGLLPFLTVRDNLLIKRRLLGRSERDAHLERLVDCLELGPFLNAYPSALSVGQQQRASIGRALAHRPALLLADEPTSALDPRLADRVLSLLLDMANEIGTAVLLATHEQGRVQALGLRRLDAQVADSTNSRTGAHAVFTEPQP